MAKFVEWPRLRYFVELHNDVSGADKFARTIQYAFALTGNIVKSKALETLGGEIAMARYLNRFCGGYTGIPQELENLVHLSWKGGWKDSQLSTQMRVSSVVMIVYYYYEILSWIGFKAPALLPRVDAGKMMRKSCVCWALWCVLELFGLYRRKRELEDMRQRQRRGAAALDEEEKNESALEKTARSLRWQAVRIGIFLIQSVGWSFESTHPLYVPDIVQNTLGIFEAYLGYRMTFEGMSISRPNIKVGGGGRRAAEAATEKDGGVLASPGKKRGKHPRKKAD